MRVGLIGFGKTGKAVASVLLQNKVFSLEWVLRRSKMHENRSVSEFFDIKSNEPGTIYSTSSIQIEKLFDSRPVDFVFDFSSGSAIFEYGKAASERKIKIISAISNYNEKAINFLRELSDKTSVFWSPNLTLGVNYLLFAAKLLKKIAPSVDIEIIEEHNKNKKEVSGTAVRIAESLDISSLSINSIRAGGIVGKHEIIFGFPFQTVRLIHESVSREAFGNGAIFVAENMLNKNKGFYKFEDILVQYIK